MGYRILGFAVWKGAGWYLRRNYPYLKPVAAGLAVAAGIGVAAVRARSSQSP